MTVAELIDLLEDQAPDADVKLSTVGPYIARVRSVTARGRGLVLIIGDGR